MHLHEGMPVGQKIVKGSGHVHAEHLIGHKPSEESGNNKYCKTPLNELCADTIQRSFTLCRLFDCRQLLVFCHFCLLLMSAFGPCTSPRAGVMTKVVVPRQKLI